jgi:hypothetical protein
MEPSIINALPSYCGHYNLQQANSCSPEHSKLCFVLHEIFRAAQNILPLTYGSGVSSKVRNPRFFIIKNYNLLYVVL